MLTSVFFLVNQHDILSFSLDWGICSYLKIEENFMGLVFWIDSVFCLFIYFFRLLNSSDLFASILFHPRISNIEDLAL